MERVYDYLLLYNYHAVPWNIVLTVSWKVLTSDLGLKQRNAWQDNVLAHLSFSTAGKYAPAAY